MALEWQWKHKMGELTYTQNGKRGVYNLYAGNCLGILLYEYEEDGERLHALAGFWNDVAHLRRLLSAKEHINIYDNVVKVKLNTYFDSDVTKIATEFAKAFAKQHINLTLEYYYQDPEEIEKERMAKYNG